MAEEPVPIEGVLPSSSFTPEFSQTYTTGSSNASAQNVFNEYVPRKSRYYYVTKAEIDTYSNLGYLSTLLFSLFGIITGFPIGAWVALLQGDLSESTHNVLVTANWITGIIAIIFLSLSICVSCWQQKNKITWDTPDNVSSKNEH